MNKYLAAIVAGSASGAAGLAIATGLLFGGSSNASADLAGAAPGIPDQPVVAFATIASSRSADEPMRLTMVSSNASVADLASVAFNAPDETAPAPPQDPVDATSHFGIDPAQSGAKLVAYETGLLGDSSAVGTGSNVTGEVFLTQSGGLGDGTSWMALDMRTLKSGDFGLSSFFSSSLEASKYPSAVFTIQSVNGIPANYTDGNQFSFTMSGPLTMHGRTQQVTWSVKARQSGDFLTMAADTDFNLTDFGWTPPDYGIQRAKNGVHLQITSIAARF